VLFYIELYIVFVNFERNSICVYVVMKELSIKDKNRLEELMANLINQSDLILGYPVSLDFNYEELMPFFRLMINNIGDPFEQGTNKVQTHEIEKEVISFFAKLLRANPKNYWGYVTNGGSESNLYGLYLAREMYPKGMVYYSDSTHYSVRKNIHLLGIPSIVIRSQENGEIDYDDFEHAIKMNRDKPAIVLATYGTTMKEAKDDVSKIKQILKNSAMHEHYIHCDAALSGAYGRFLEPRIPFDFEDGSDSISISAHKFIGAPIPAGVIITKKTNKDRIANSVSYIDTLDTTITGSRNGHSSLFLWYALKQYGIEGLRERYEHSLETARYCVKRMNDIGIKAWTNPGAITVVTPIMPKEIISKWQLATNDEISHIICMPSITKVQIDALIVDIENCEVQKKEFVFDF
jgi:histidine decarboxylase